MATLFLLHFSPLLHFLFLSFDFSLLLIERFFVDILLPGEGIEPSQPYSYQILSLARLPIPPPRHIIIQHVQHYSKAQTEINCIY